MSLRVTVREALAVRGFCEEVDSLLRLAPLTGTSGRIHMRELWSGHWTSL